MSHDDTKPLPTPDESRTDPDSRMPAHPSDIPTEPGLGIEVTPTVEPVDLKKTVPARRGAALAEAITKEEPLASRTQERVMPNEAPTAPGKAPVMIRDKEDTGHRAATTVRDLPVKMIVDSAATTEPLPGPKVNREAVTAPDRPLLKREPESGPHRNPLASTDEVQIDELLSGMGADEPRAKAKGKPAAELRPDGSKAESHAAAAPPPPRVEKPSDGSVLVAQSDPPAPPAKSEPLVAQAKPADDRTTVPPVLPRGEPGPMRRPLPTMPVRERGPRPWWALAAVFLAVLAIGGAVIWLVDMRDKVPPPVIETNPTTAPTATPRVGEPRGPTPDQPVLAPSAEEAPAGSGAAAPGRSTKGARPPHKGAPSGAASASATGGAPAPGASGKAPSPANPDKDLFQPNPN